MLIAYDHQIFQFQEYGGISRYFVEIASKLTEKNQAVSIIAPIYKNAYLRNYPRRLNIIGFQKPRFLGVGRLCKVVNALISSLYFKMIQPDIVHETYFSPYRFAPRRSKIVLTVYDMIQEKFPQFYKANDPTPRYKLIAAARADHIICISETTRKDLIEIFNIPPEKTSAIHLGFKLSGKLETGQLPVLVQKPCFLFVGQRGGYKNFRCLLSAYARSRRLLKEFSLVVFGGGDLSNDERKLISELGIPTSCIQHKSGEDTVLAALYSQATALLYPSLYEGFGIPPLEAMSFGCPVICSNAGSLPEIVGDAALLVDPCNAEDMTEKMEELAYSTALQGKLVKRGHIRIKQFSWDKCAAETLSVYNKLHC
jgi:glycosyltransferase involved in cell wall biosynthesis